MAAIDDMIFDFGQRLLGLSENTRLGYITILGWQSAFNQELGAFSSAAWLLGSGQSSIPEGAEKALIDHLKFQMKHFDDFMVEVQDNDEWLNGWLSRAASYAPSIKTPYWNGAVYPLPLPAMPAQGTQCMNNCGCSWDIQVVDAKAGDYDCYWVRGKDDSCQTCLQRADDWSPYQIRGFNDVTD